MKNEEIENAEASSREKRFKTKFLVLMLDEIKQNGNNRKEMMKNLKRSSANLGYYLRKLRTAGLAQRVQSFPYSIYRLTDLGERIKENLAHSEGAKNYWRCHALVVGFPIKDFGCFDWSKVKVSHMKNWHFAEDTMKDGDGRIWRLRIQSSGLLTVSCPEMITENPKDAFGNMFDIASRLAKNYAEWKKMEIGYLKVIREGHKELIGSESLAALFGRIKIDDVFVDESQKDNPRLEETQSSNVLEKLLELPTKVNRLEGHLVRQTEIMDKFTEQIALHLTVMQKIGDSFDEWRREMRSR